MHTSSLNFPKMFDVAHNTVAVATDTNAVVNRSRLLILTEPTELYNEPEFGVGLKQHLFKYNTENEKAIIRNRVVEQLRMHEPCCIPDETAFADGLLFTGDQNSIRQDYNELKMTIAIRTTFGDTANVSMLQTVDTLTDEEGNAVV